MSTVITKNDQSISQKAAIIVPGVKMIGIINNRGRLVDFMGSDSIDMSKEKREMFFMKIALRNSMQRDFNEELGVVNYCMTQRGDSKFISIPICDCNTIFVVTKKNVNSEKVVDEIRQMLLHSKQFLGVKISNEMNNSG
jgi:hypothetical protein